MDEMYRINNSLYQFAAFEGRRRALAKMHERDGLIEGEMVSHIVEEGAYCFLCYQGDMAVVRDLAAEDDFGNFVTRTFPSDELFNLQESINTTIEIMMSISWAMHVN